MKKTLLLLVATATAVVAVACHRSHVKGPKYSESNEGGEEQGARNGPGTPPPTTASGTCDGSCTHYLQCKGNYDPSAQPACVTKCNQMALSQQ